MWRGVQLGVERGWRRARRDKTTQWIVQPRWAERGSGDRRSGAFGSGAAAADAVNSLMAVVWWSGRDGTLPVSIDVWLRVPWAQVAGGLSLWALIA